MKTSHYTSRAARPDRATTYLPGYMLHQVEEHPADRFGMFTNHRVFGGVEALTTVGVLLIDLPGVWVAHSRQYAQPGSPTSALTVPGSTGSNTTTAPVTSARAEVHMNGSPERRLRAGSMTCWLFSAVNTRDATQKLIIADLGKAVHDRRCSRGGLSYARQMRELLLRRCYEVELKCVGRRKTEFLKIRGSAATPPTRGSLHLPGFLRRRVAPPRFWGHGIMLPPFWPERTQNSSMKIAFSLPSAPR